MPKLASTILRRLIKADFSCNVQPDSGLNEQQGGHVKGGGTQRTISKDNGSLVLELLFVAVFASFLMMVIFPPQLATAIYAGGADSQYASETYTQTQPLPHDYQLIAGVAGFYTQIGAPYYSTYYYGWLTGAYYNVLIYQAKHELQQYEVKATQDCGQVVIADVVASGVDTTGEFTIQGTSMQSCYQASTYVWGQWQNWICILGLWIPGNSYTLYATAVIGPPGAL